MLFPQCASASVHCPFPHLLSSTLQIFLEMVLIGREDTLLQLAKTDKEKSGRQLLALLTLDDAFTSDKTRKSLHKNAFALMKLRRYRDAAAVFLLADPPYLKEACSVLSKQYGDPMLALLVARLVEHRAGVRRAAALSVAAAGATTPTSVALSAGVLAGSGGYALGSASRVLLQSDILPGLVEAQQLGSAGLSAIASESLSSTSTPYQAFERSGVGALCLVCALWLQDRRLLSDTCQTLFGPNSLVDSCLEDCGKARFVTLNSSSSNLLCLLFSQAVVNALTLDRL